MKNLMMLVLLALVFKLTTFAQEFKQVHDGIEYAQFTRQVKINDKETAPTVVNALRLDLKKVRLDIHHAMDAAIGTEKTSSISTRHGAFAAINAGFFRLDTSIFKGDAAGILQIDHKLLSEPINNRIALFISNNNNETAINFAHLTLLNNLRVKGEEYQLEGINRERKRDDIVLYTPEFNRTTLTNSDGIELIVRNGKITQISDGKGSSIIPLDGFVLSASGKNREYVQKHKVGAKVEYSFNDIDLSSRYIDSSTFKKPTFYSFAEDIIGGVPQLIKNGKIEITWEQEKSSKSFVETRHPRTAVAKLRDGKALLITVDGRQPGISVGMNLPEFAEMLLEMGAVDAMNLDGGGSTTMFLDGKVVNKPSDKEGERAVSDAILVTLRKTK